MLHIKNYTKNTEK